MRKNVKADILGIIRTLKRAAEKNGALISMGDVTLLQEFLTECQTAAIDVGNAIEESEGEGNAVIPVLEEYCELLYQVLVSGEAHTAELQDCLTRAEAEINAFPERIEAVFLPYKASMWDSLESVWMAARDDENCNAYVIPIPYFDKKPDGSFGQMHYEGNEYPAYVPITKYDEYDFAKRKPDMIFIHNPYDGSNFVTSVHPFFYSDNLKKFTDKLVYIPYFVLGEIDPEDEKAIEGMAHFCTAPGILYADKVIVQSEDMRKIYIKVITDWLGEEVAGKLKLEEKILGLGSPKFDKVARAEDANIILPQAWEKVLQKPDGTRKKVILYNNSISALLKHGNDMLEKMKDVLNIFKENQEEVALLWRPHPLIKTTIESMRPELVQGYEAIVNNYLKEGWGIYDDTADLDRAIAVSDAYYGDGSSLVQLYEKAGKPVMIQNVEIIGRT